MKPIVACYLNCSFLLEFKPAPVLFQRPNITYQVWVLDLLFINTDYWQLSQLAAKVAFLIKRCNHLPAFIFEQVQKSFVRFTYKVVFEDLQ